jgi:glycerophosphoryl diester phosphodiesterase
MLQAATVLSFDFPTLQAIKTLAPSLPACALVSTAYLERMGRRSPTAGPSAVAAEIAALGVELAGVDRRWLTESLYGELRRRGLGVGVWTVDDAAEMRRFRELGVDFITTNRPDVLRATLDEARSRG